MGSRRQGVSHHDRPGQGARFHGMCVVWPAGARSSPVGAAHGVIYQSRELAGRAATGGVGWGRGGPWGWPAGACRKWCDGLWKESGSSEVVVE
jgi:hypothetical protein